MAREQFQRGWKDGGAEFTSHYNAKLNTCFYLLTVASGETLRRMLFDFNGGELYGEYLGPASGTPKSCRVESTYCASEREWRVLVGPYMED